MEKVIQNTASENTSFRARGIALVLTGAVLWGVSGTIAQYLFQHLHVHMQWLTVLRLLVSGVLLLGVCYRKEKSRIWAVWADPSARRSLVCFAIFGMLGVQYTYFSAIKYGNAATATVLQSLEPVVVTCYLAARFRKMPDRKQLLAVGLAFAGTSLLVTHGSFTTLSISGRALFWGVLTAFAATFYTLQPHKLLMQWGSVVTVGWGMLVGGIVLSFIHPPWQAAGEFSLAAFLAIAFVIAFGTLTAFFCYLESLKYLSAAETSVLATAEPLTAAFLSVVWLHVSIGFFECIGSLMIISTIFILSFKEKRKAS
ncbi:permease [Weizmannia acidilactici]|uniref:DMT family transporter n=1 Tax=Weizmannia acidilactici TaxID=2607726 RepID=UPI00124F2613|nr:DMT family transporter [Weizmannia acidilactici]GER66858.1 permease [Weizmannia acidilactici]